MLTGSALRFEIWKKISDHYNWEKYIEYFEKEPEFDAKKSSDLIRIYTFLRDELGKSYLKNSHRDGRNLVNYWLWSRGQTYSELKWLTEAMSYFKSKPDSNYEKVRSYLGGDNKCNEEGIPFLVAGDSLRKAGFEVVFEPQVEFRRKPDLKIINPDTAEILYGDVTQLNDSDELETKRTVFDIIFEAFHFTPPVVPFAAKIHGIADKKQLDELKNYILEIKEMVFQENLFLSVGKEETNGILEFAVAHPDKAGEVEEWEKVRKLAGMNEVLGLLPNLDYTSRLLSKLEDKAKQLPDKFPGIIYVPLPSMYFYFGIPDPSYMVDPVQRKLDKYPHVIGACFYVHLGNTAEDHKQMFDWNYYERKTIHETTRQDVLFIRNKTFNHDLGALADTQLKLYTSFGNLFQ